VRLGTKDGDKALFKTVIPDPDVAGFLSGLLKRPGDLICFTHVEPDFLPLIIVEDQDVKLKQRIDRDDADKRIGTAALMLAKLHTNKIDDKQVRRVFINMNSPLIE
jgi:molecular chaperone HtpG